MRHPLTGLSLTLRIHDKDGVLIRVVGPRPARSFLVNHMKHLYAALTQTNLLGVVDTSGVSEDIQVSGGTLGWSKAIAAIADNTYGTQVGTGTTAVLPTQTALVTLIAEGVAASQLNYGATTIAVVAAGSTEVTMDITRSFANNSGGSINVQEVGLAVTSPNSIGTQHRFLVVRDLTGAVSVGAGQTLTVVYTYRTVL